MLVYGDRSERVDPRARLTQIEQKVRAISVLPQDAARHSALRDVLIDAGRLLQGVADADFAVAGCDRWSPATIVIADLLQAIAGEFCRFLDGDAPDAVSAITIPADLVLPGCVDLKVPEGYAYYSLYPEGGIDAARSLELPGPVRVLGIRSIGTSLAAVTAAAIGAPRPTTVRPFGSPYAREVAISDDLAAELLGTRDADFLIVDEGPGQSGSSFGAVADWLESRGVPRRRIIFLSSHEGDLGPHASKAHRSRWQGARKAVVRFDAGAFLRQWSAAELEDISTGQWRSRVFDNEALWPAVNPTWERAKFLTRKQGRPVMLKFAGFGDDGLRKLQRAKLLHAAGLTAEPIELVHGFLAEHWLEDAVPLPPGAKPLRELAHYIGTRARGLPAGDPGASLHELLRMARRNVGLAFGQAAAERLDHWESRLSLLQEFVVPVETDNRLDRHEWMMMPDGRLLKSDALDHCHAHDLVGCQDVAWDIAGAAIEFDLQETGTELLANDVEAITGRPIEPELLSFLRTAYLAFRLGQASLSLEMTGSDEAERARLRALAARYRHPLETLLEQRIPAANPRLSSIGAVGE